MVNKQVNSQQSGDDQTLDSGLAASTTPYCQTPAPQYLTLDSVPVRSST